MFGKQERSFDQHLTGVKSRYLFMANDRRKFKKWMCGMLSVSCVFISRAKSRTIFSVYLWTSELVTILVSLITALQPARCANIKTLFRISRYCVLLQHVLYWNWDAIAENSRKKKRSQFEELRKLADRKKDSVVSWVYALIIKRRSFSKWE